MVVRRREIVPGGEVVKSGASAPDPTEGEGMLGGRSHLAGDPSRSDGVGQEMPPPFVVGGGSGAGSHEGGHEHLVGRVGGVGGPVDLGNWATSSWPIRGSSV